jgi:fibronectin-binding autotransporter adhesin
MISRVRSLSLICLGAFGCAGLVRAQSYIPWNGLGLSANWTESGNWEGTVAPVNDGNGYALFGTAARTDITVDVAQSMKGVKFDFSTATDTTYSFSGSTTALTLGTGGLIIDTGATVFTSYTPSQVSASTPGTVQLQSSLGLVLGAAQTWTLASGTSALVASPVSGNGTLTLAGDGFVSFSGNNTRTGDTVLTGGALGVGHNNALGTGALRVNGNSTLYTGSTRSLANALFLNASSLILQAYGSELRFTGPVTLGANATLNTTGSIVYVDGDIGETGGARFFTASGTAPVVLSGNNTYTGGTQVFTGHLLFRNALSVPATGSISTDPQGYVGAGFATNIVSGYLSKFSPANTSGTIGFDTDPAAASANIIAEPIDLTGFNSLARLGTATRATLSSNATITPAAAGYRFGGGGGTLRVESRLTGTGTSVTADSSQGTELTIYLTYNDLILGGNNYTGPTNATHAAIVFGSGSAPLTSTFTLGAGGYIGTQDLALLPSSWIGNFATSTLTGMIGWDTPNVASPIVVGSILTPIDLGRFTGNGATIALGTTSAATLAGAITLPANQADYHFGGYKGGWLTVNSTLSGARAVRIGDAYGDIPDVDRNDLTRISSVFLGGNNTHSGGTFLYSGRLVLDHASALGTGALTVDRIGGTVDPKVETSLTANPTFGNALLVGGAFNLGGANSFGWSGAIANATGAGRITKYGASTLTLSGNNTAFTRGFYIDEGTIAFTTDTAAGTGSIDFGSAVGATAAFTSSAPSIGGLDSSPSTARVTVGSGTTLTINQASSGTFRGQISGSGAIIKSGSGALRLEGNNTYSGGTTITAGTVTAAASSALGSSAVTLNGATSELNLLSGVTLANSLSIGANGGLLAGSGVFTSNVAIGTGSGLSPGNPVGTLSFTNGLTWGQGGYLRADVQNATGGAGVGWDSVQVTGTLTFNATTGAPFTIFLRTVDSTGAAGSAVNFVPTNAYSWTILTSTNLSGFNPNAVTLDTSGFTSAVNGGTFSLSTSSNNLIVDFTPVPEPETWALLVTGLGIAGYQALRRRRNARQN